MNELYDINFNSTDEKNQFIPFQTDELSKRNEASKNIKSPTIIANENENDDIFQDSSYNQNISKNKEKIYAMKLAKKIKGNTKTTKLGKKLGRKPKGSTEIGNHTSESDDNKRRKHWRTFLKKIRKCVNALIKKENIGELKPTNFIDQFGSSLVQNRDFIKLKIYKYFTFIKNEGNDGGNGQKNEAIIREMVLEKKNAIFIALMKSSIEDMYSKYIKNDNIIIVNGEEVKLTQFDTIKDVIKEQKAEYEKDNCEDIEEKLISFEEESTTLIDYIENVPERKEENDAQLQYIIIPELENELDDELGHEFNLGFNPELLPEVNSGPFPDINNGAFPEINNGSLHEVNNGLFHDVNNGLFPEVNNRLLPEVNYGLFPEVNNRLLPEVNNGLFPDDNSGLFSEVNNRLPPEVNYGLFPDVNNGLFPEANNELFSELFS